MIADPQRESAKREIRRRIGRSRRRIDGRLRAVQRRGRELLSWRAYVRRFPGYAALGAMGVGLALSAGFARRRLARWIGLKLLRRTSNHLARLFWKELRQLWADSAPQRGGHAAAAERQEVGHG